MRFLTIFIMLLCSVILTMGPVLLAQDPENAAQDKVKVKSKALSLLDVLPERTLMMIGCPNVDAAKEALKSSNIRKLLKEPEIQRCIQPLRDKMRPRIEMMMREFEQKIGISLEDALAVASGEIAAAVVDLDPGNQEMPVGAVVHLQVGSHLKAAFHLRNLLLKMTGIELVSSDYKGVNVYTVDGVPCAYTLLGNSFVLTSQQTLLEELIDNYQQPPQQGLLAQTTDTAVVTKKLFPEGEVCTLAMHFNFGQLFTRFGEMIPPHVAGPMSAIGVMDIRSISLGFNMHDGFHVSRFFLYAPGTKKGIHKLYQFGKPDLASAAGQVPATSMLFSAGSFDFAAFLNTIEEIITLVDPEEQFGLFQQYQGFMGMVEQRLGFKLKDDLAAAFGTTGFSSLNFPQGGGLIPEGVQVHSLRDQEKAQQCIESLAKLLQLQIKSFAVGEHTISYFVSPMGQLGTNPFEEMENAETPMHAIRNVVAYAMSGIAFTYQDNQIYIAESTQAMQQYLDWQTSGAQALVSLKSFQENLAKNSSMFIYMDYRSLISRWYNTLRVLVRSFEGYIRGAGVPLQSALLPRSQTLSKHFGPGNIAFFVNEEGLLLSSKSTINLVGISTGAIVAAIAIPNIINKLEHRRRLKPR